MFSQGSHNPQSGQGPQTPRPPPYLQHLPVPPPHLPHNFQQGPLLPSTQFPPRPVQPCMSMYQHGPLAPHFRQAPPGGMSSTDQPYLHPPPTVHGSAPLPRLYTSAQQNLQHSSYSVLGPPPPPSVSQSPEVLQPPLPPAPSHGQTLYRAPIYQLPQQQGVVQGLQHIPSPPLPLPTSTSAVSGNTSEATDRNSQVSAMAPLPPLLPPPPPPIPPSSPTSVSLSLPAGLSAKAIAAPDVPRQMKPTMPTNPLMVARESHSPDDSDMEMEDDITRSDVDQATHKPIEGPTHASGPISSEFDAEKQLYTLTHSVGSEASTMVLSHDFDSSKLGEQGSKLVSSFDDLTFGGSLLKVQSPVINSAGATESFINDGVNYSTALVDDKSSTKVAAPAECINSGSYSGQAMKGSSPFRLLQDYASNDSSENDEDPCSKDANTETVSSVLVVGTENCLGDTGLNLKMDTGSKIERGFGLLSKSSMPCGVPDFSSDSQREFKETVPTSIANGSTTELLVIKLENQSSIDHASSPKALPKADVPRGTQENVPFSGKYEEDNEDKPAKLISSTQKIDKFGRLVREGASDSDSDDSRHGRRRNRRGRSQSWSRSRSPLNSRRRRRRRSRPRRRREKRSKSRSWSPGNRRSRNRSPSFRHTGEFSRGNMRREKGHLPDCFDFLRGKCYRGASCRYMHHATEKNDGSRHHRSKQQYVQLTSSSKNCSTVEDNNKLSPKVLDHEQDIMNRGMQHNHDMSASSSGAKKECTVLYKRQDSVCDALFDSDLIKSDSLRKFPAKVLEIIVQERSEDVKISVDEKAMESDWPTTVDGFQAKHATDTNIPKSHKEASQDALSSLKDSQIQQSQSVPLDPALADTDHPSQQSDDSSISDLSPDKTSRTSPKKLHASETLQNSADSPCKPCSASNLEDNNYLHTTQLTSDYNLVPQTVPFQSQSAPLESFPSYMLPNQNSLFSVPSSSSSASAMPLPPPPLLLPHGPTVNAVPLWPPHCPTVNAGTAQPGVALQFQQSGLPSRIDFSSQMFSRPYSTELSGYSQVSGFQHRAYPRVQEPHRPSLEVEHLMLKSLPGCNLSGQQLEGPSPFEENHLKQPLMQALGTSDSSICKNNYPQHMAYSHDGTASKMQSFSSDNLPPGDILKSSQIYPYSQQRQPPYNLHNPVPDSAYVLPGKINSLSRYPPDLQDRNQPSHPPDFGVSKNSTHFNPYASTFEKPLSSKFSSNVFRQEKDSMYSSNHNHPSSLSHASVDGQGVGSIQETSPTSASGVRKIIPRSGGDRYDPLFDSFEPSSNSYKKSDHIHNWEPSGDSDIMLRLRGSNQPLDVEERNRKKDASGIALATSLDNEEFGETADAEVGDVENGSQSNPHHLADINVGEMEIDQIKSTGNSMRSKDSRSMKLFKVCLAEFVKEVLKPSWQQGNMSKETFKTVVKKTVDKVSGAMKSHQIPKSKTKINQYIDSSQRKLTKLVMGYVDKYAKR